MASLGEGQLLRSISIQTLEKTCDSNWQWSESHLRKLRQDGWTQKKAEVAPDGSWLFTVWTAPWQSLTAATVDCFCLTVPSGLAQLMLGKWILP